MRPATKPRHMVRINITSFSVVICDWRLCGQFQAIGMPPASPLDNLLAPPAHGGVDSSDAPSKICSRWPWSHRLTATSAVFLEL